MCKNCGKKSCTKCSGSQSETETLAQVVNKLNELEALVDELQSDAKFLKCGHPIMMLEQVDDIECFDMDTGLGSECWEGWVVCDGTTYQNAAGKNIVTPAMFNRFPVGAGDVYEVGDTGGSDSVVLAVPQLPAHSHNVIDPSHTHVVTDPGHLHAATAAPHTHTFTGNPHTHTMDTAGAHTHNVQVGNQGSGDRGGGSNSTATSGLSTFTTGGAGDHSHTLGNATGSGTVGDTTVAVSTSNAFTGISIVTNTTGISIVSTGSNEAHENRPPFIAVLFVMKLS